MIFCNVKRAEIKYIRTDTLVTETITKNSPNFVNEDI